MEHVRSPARDGVRLNSIEVSVKSGDVQVVRRRRRRRRRAAFGWNAGLGLAAHWNPATKTKDGRGRRDASVT